MKSLARVAALLARVAAALAATSGVACSSVAAQDPSAPTPAAKKAIETRTPEDPKLVWTASSVVLVAKEVSPGVFAVHPDDAAVKNAGGIPAATSGGFVVGTNGVLVIESMLNRRLAEQMLALVREKTDKPIHYVVNTSYHGDHSYGNQFFPKDARFIQHERTQAYIRAHFADDVTFMKKYFGENQGLDELKPHTAQLLFHDGAQLDVDLGGKHVQIMHLGFAQTVGDLFVWLPNEKVLYTGNPIISEGPSLPWLLDGKLEESLATMRRLRDLLPKDAVVVPGHGVPTGVNAIEHTIHYLEELRKQVGEAVNRGLSEQETVQRLAESMKQYNGYKIFPWVHSTINVPKTFQEMKSTMSTHESLPGGFTEKTATVDGVRINYKIGGRGPVVVLLHGYAQTSHMWLPLMPLLAGSHTVIAPDLRGAGGSERTVDGYDKKTLAKDIHGLVQKLGHEQVMIVGHDIGLMVAYAYAAQFPTEVKRVVLLDAFLPGVGDWKNVWLLRDLWHFHFHGETAIALVKGRERVYFEHFWNDFAADKTKSIPEADRELYSAAYARADGMRAGFQYFKAFEQDAKDFAAFSATKLEIPFLVITGEKASGTFLIDQTKLVASKVTGNVVKGSGHWLMEEAGAQVAPEIVEFLK